MFSFHPAPGDLLAASPPWHLVFDLSTLLLHPYVPPKLENMFSLPPPPSLRNGLAGSIDFTSLKKLCAFLPSRPWPFACSPPTCAVWPGHGGFFAFPAL